nr:hypothetical protein [Tanacetum cinerariifolium]
DRTRLGWLFLRVQNTGIAVSLISGAIAAGFFDELPAAPDRCGSVVSGARPSASGAGYPAVAPSTGPVHWLARLTPPGLLLNRSAHSQFRLQPLAASLERTCGECKWALISTSGIPTMPTAPHALAEVGGTAAPVNHVMSAHYEVDQRIRQFTATDVAVRDASILGSAQRALHYWIAFFGSVRDYAAQAGCTKQNRRCKPAWKKRSRPMRSVHS